MLATIEEAFNPQDKESIFVILREGVGFHRLNFVVLERVRGCGGLDFDEKLKRKMTMATLQL
jgi:hypothetical protein